MLWLIILLLSLALLFPFYLLYRNDRVCDFRINMIYNDYESYEQLPEHNEMLYQFWRPLTKEEWLDG